MLCQARKQSDWMRPMQGQEAYEIPYIYLRCWNTRVEWEVTVSWFWSNRCFVHDCFTRKISKCRTPHFLRLTVLWWIFVVCGNISLTSNGWSQIATKTVDYGPSVKLCVSHLSCRFVNNVCMRSWYSWGQQLLPMSSQIYMFRIHGAIRIVLNDANRSCLPIKMKH